MDPAAHIYLRDRSHYTSLANRFGAKLSEILSEAIRSQDSEDMKSVEDITIVQVRQGLFNNIA